MAILSETRKIKSSSSNEEVIYKLMNNASVDETTSDAVDVSLANGVTLIVESGAGVSGGVVTLEASRTSDYTGTWASIGTITTSAATQAYALTLGGNNDIASNEVSLPLPYIRARISTGISGGNVSVYLIVRK